MQATIQVTERQTKRTRVPLVWPKRRATAVAPTHRPAAQEVNLLPELEEFLRQSKQDAPYVPAREGLLG